jgi:ornithine cyclodeaminase
MSTQLPFYSAEDILRALPMRRAIEVMREAFRAVHAGRVTMPVRLGMPTPNGLSLFMPAHITLAVGEPALGQKVVHVFPGNRALGLPTIHALVTLFDAQTGRPKALLEGTTLTALRTGAVTGLATDIMSNPQARVLAVIGAGGQAFHQIEAVCAVRPIAEVRIVSRGNSAQALAERLQKADAVRRYVAPSGIEQAVRGADVIVCTTTSSEPLFPASWVAPGTHVNAIGAYTPKMRSMSLATF